MVFDAHDKAFAHFGGACARGIYDSEADERAFRGKDRPPNVDGPLGDAGIACRQRLDVILIGKERRFNARFERMCSHHLVEPTACSPAAGWEKGQVENQVKTSRQRYFTPRLRVADYAELNAVLRERGLAQASSARHPEFKDRTIRQVFDEEQATLVTLQGPFRGFHELTAAVSKTCLVTFDRNRYSVAATAAGRPVQLRAYATRIVLLQDGEIVGEHDRAFGRDRTIYDPWHYVPVLERKPPLGECSIRLPGDGTR